MRELVRLKIAMGRRTFLLAQILLVSIFPSFAHAQLDEFEGDWVVLLGGGVVSTPAFRGSDDYQMNAPPFVMIRYRDVFEISLNRGARYNLFRGENFKAGPITRPDFGRREDGDNIFRVAGPTSDALIGMGDIGETIEIGGFASYAFEPFTATFELRQAVTGHSGFVGRIGIEYEQRFEPFGGVVILQIEPELRFAGDTFTRSYFGVSADQSAKTGYAPYHSGGGIYSYGIGATVIVPLSERFFTAFVANYDDLVGDARNSPFVLDSGSVDQSTLGFFVAYRLGE